jgi:Exopolyphosphatase
VHLDLERYDRSRVDGMRLPIRDMHQTIARLLEMRPYERFNHPCIGADRSDYILAGCAICMAITRTWPFEEITVADRGVREGIIMDQLMSASR